MALNLTNLFTALGRIGRNGFIINSAQDVQETPFNELSGYSYINPAWIASLAQSYDPAIRVESAGMSVWQSAAQIILQQFVLADAPAYGGTLGASLLHLLSEMVDQSATVQECDVQTGATPDPANVGDPTVYLSKTRHDGLIFQNTISETGTLIFTDDSYTGSATRNQEPWQWSGAQNISSLGTGTGVGLWDWDWPTGSGSTTTGANIDGAQDATATGNYLTNGDFEDWTGTSPAVLDNWFLSGGVWGTDLIRSGATDGIDGTYCVEFIAGTATTEFLTQQFDSDVTDGTDATAGTDVELTAFKTYIFNVFLKADGVIAGGVLTVSLVDSTGTVLVDEAGNNQTSTIALTAHATDWTTHTIEYRLPVRLPTNGIVRLKIHMSTALTGANLFMDYAAFAQPTQLYAGGPTAISFANPASPVEAGPDPDAFQLQFQNDYGDAPLRATWQTLVSRLFQTPDLILPYASTPTISDGLIQSGAAALTVTNLLYPQTVAATGSTTPAVDCNDLPFTFQYTQHCGAFTDITSLDGKIEESTTGVGAWTDMAGGAFTQVTASDDIQTIVATRTKRYIRYTYTLVVGGAPEAYLAASFAY